jgi:hypothetical protein
MEAQLAGAPAVVIEHPARAVHRVLDVWGLLRLLEPSTS